MIPTQTYDVAIAGGGLAGLSAASQLRQQGYSVLVVEKERYPLHRVCGEYIGMESRDYLMSLGIPLDAWQLPRINVLQMTAPGGRSLEIPLGTGGFGLSRYKLDAALAAAARARGVVLLENTRVEDIRNDGGHYTIHLQDGSSLQARIALGAWGKRSNLDIRWNRAFLNLQDKRLRNYVGIKYHVHISMPRNLIGLHHFHDGYCGISAVEDDRYCLCYLTRSVNLRRAGNDIARMEHEVLSLNPHLKNIFAASSKVDGFPVVISQVNFKKKPAVENGVLMLGDTAGMIAPLCGNGMSIALHTGKLGAEAAHRYLSGKIGVKGMEDLYRRNWQQAFASRLRMGRVLHRLFGSARSTDVFLAAMQRMPFLIDPLVRSTHGKPF